MNPDERDAPLKPILKQDLHQMRASAKPWWPEGFGSSPDASGAQSTVNFAYFANAMRLLVKRDDDVITYNTRGHDIRGISFDASGKIRLDSDKGELTLDLLHRL